MAYIDKPTAQRATARKRPPAPVPLRRKLGPIALYRAVRANSIAVWHEDAYAADIIIDRGPVGDFVLVNAPDAIRRVLLDNAGNYPKDDLQIEKLTPALGRSLLTTEGNDWKVQRRIAAPLFQPQAIATYLPDIADATEAALARWAAPAQDGTPVNFAREMQTLTYDIISRTVFSSELEAPADVMGAAITRYFEALGRIDLWDFLNLPAWLPRPALWRVRPAIRVLRGEVQRLLERRRAAAAAGLPLPRDLVTLLAEARDPETGGALPEAVIHDNLVTFIGAGHETVGNALTWTMFLLAEFPDAFERLALEADSVLGDRRPVAEDLSRLVFTRMVLEESMRLYPPAPFMSRQAIAADTLAGRPIRPRARIVISPWVLHRHRQSWADPDLFDPERFAPDRRALIGRFAYLPFGAGPRVCIGAGFAMQEAIVTLAMMARRYQPRPVQGAVIEPVATMALRPAHGMPLRLVPRR